MSASAAALALRQPQTSRLRVEEVTDLADFATLEAEWDRLVGEAGASPFVRHEWLRSWWECFGGGRTLCVLLVREGSELIGAAPFMRSQRRICGLRMRALSFMANGHTPRMDVLIARHPVGVWRSLWQHLRERRELWDVLVLQELCRDAGPSLTLLARLALGAGFRVGLWPSAEAPYISLVGGWEAYYRGLRPKHRSNLRNRSKRLENLGRVRRRLVARGEDLSAALDDAFRIEAAAWKARAGTAILSRPETVEFYRALAARAAQRGWLRLSFLEVGGRRVAFQYALECAGKQYLLKVGYDPAFSAYSPQNLLCELVLRDAFERRVEEYDFLGEREDWKLEWASRLRRHGWLYVLPDDWRGRAVDFVKFRVLPRLHRERLYLALRDRLVPRGQGLD